jgi:hypothetical protein
VANWIESLRLRCGPLTDAASVFAAMLGVEGDPPHGPLGLLLLARAVERHLSDDPQAELLSEPDDDRMFVELGGSYLALLLSHELTCAQHAQIGGQHGIHLGKGGFYDPFAALERVLAADDVRAALAHEVALAEARVRPSEHAAPAQPDASWKMFRTRILPRLIGPRFYETLGKSERELPVCAEPLVGDLRVAFIVREPGRARYVRSDEAERWNAPPPELRRAGVRNLARCSAEARLLRFDAADGALVVARTGDGLDASRLLLPGLHDVLAAELGSPFAAAVPHRDALFACSLTHPSALSALRARAIEEAARAPHAITAGLFAVGPYGSLTSLPA